MRHQRRRRPPTAFEARSFGVATGSYGKGPRTIVVRVVQGDVELARYTASRGAPVFAEAA